MPCSVYISVLVLLLIFNKSLFFAFFGVSSSDSGYEYSHPYPDSPSFLKFFSECCLVDPLQWEVDPFQLSFLSWLKPLVTPLLLCILLTFWSFQAWRRLEKLVTILFVRNSAKVSKYKNFITESKIIFTSLKFCFWLTLYLHYTMPSMAETLIVNDTTTLRGNSLNTLFWGGWRGLPYYRPRIPGIIPRFSATLPAPLSLQDKTKSGSRRSHATWLVFDKTSCMSSVTVSSVWQPFARHFKCFSHFVRSSRAAKVCMLLPKA